MTKPILKYVLIGVLGSLVLVSILPQPDHKVLNMSRVTPHVLESNALFFKNLRQYYYDKMEDEKSGYTIFSHPDQKKLNALTPKFRIVDNWRHDEAYILMDIDESLRNGAEMVMKTPSDEFRYSINNMTSAKSLELAVCLYDALRQDSVMFFIEQNEHRVAIWSSPEERSVLKTILKDYFKLIGAL
ncbi:MAG: hypothetical protein Salg2KO_09360 [Salibacteraceae bacterium]